MEVIQSLGKELQISTAVAIQLELARQGIPRDAIHGGYLDCLYNKLIRYPDAPNFTSVDRILPEVRPTKFINQTPVCGVIVETRKHPALVYVVSNVARILDVSIQIFHGLDAKEFILSSALNWLISTGQVILTPLGVNTLSASEYNALLLSRRFWESMGSKNKILIFQADSLLCQNSDYTINNFLEFDYIGSKWPRRRPVGIYIDGGNGGLSLRDWNKTMECLQRFPSTNWVGGEDGYYGFHLDLMGAVVGRDKSCAQFSTQYEFLHRSFGAHNVLSLDARSLHAFLHYCPDAEVLLNPYLRNSSFSSHIRDSFVVSDDNGNRFQ